MEYLEGISEIKCYLCSKKTIALSTTNNKKIPPTTVVELLVHSKISVTSFYNEVIDNIQCHIILKI